MDLRLASSLRPVDLVVFDCDGVLLDTMRAKIDAFRAWVPETHREHEEAFMGYVTGSFGHSRTIHIEHFYRNLVRIPVDACFLSAEVERFTDLCEPKCAAAGWRRGSREFVEACRAGDVLRCVLSGAPQAPLEAMLALAPGFEAGMFHRIIGSPPGKPESLTKLLTETGISAQRTVFIGDAAADQEAARHVGAHFVYFPSEARRPASEIETEVRDLRELLP